ncbi:F0F1 ATP synthase subunit A [soil metagenome]
MHISLAAEHLALFGLHITNSIFTTWIVSLVLIIGAIMLRKKLSQVPGKFQSTVEMIYLYFLDSATSIIGRRDIAMQIFPFVATLFFFITLSNWSGLLPGNHSFGLIHGVDESGHPEIISFLRPPSTDLNLVAVMALFAVGYVQYIGIKFLGAKNYIGKFFNFSSPILFFVGILELVAEFTRIISYSFRLFGNIFAGKVLVTVIFFLTLSLAQYIPFIPLPFYMLEMFVGAIQAFVFCFLVIVLTAVAVTSHDNHGEHEAPSLTPITHT